MPDKEFINTYTLLTAENALRQLGISIPSKKLTAIIKQNETFYKKILSPFCDYIINQQILDYCETLDTFSHSEIKHLSTAYKNYLKRNEITLTQSDPTLTEIANIKDQLNILNFRRNKLNENQQETLKLLTEKIQELINEWQTLQRLHAEQLSAALIADGYSIPTHFKENLAEKLIFQDSDVNQIPSDLLTTLNIKNRIPTLIEKALISALREDTKHG